MREKGEETSSVVCVHACTCACVCTEATLSTGYMYIHTYGATLHT